VSQAMGLGTKNRQKQTAETCKRHLREKYRDQSRASGGIHRSFCLCHFGLLLVGRNGLSVTGYGGQDCPSNACEY
jgi:hypothetical protein